MPLRDYSFVRLHDECDHLDAFDCGNKDLNEFLCNDSKDYCKQLMAVTYLFENHAKEIVAFFSVANDNLSVKDVEKAKKRKINKRIRFSKQRKYYPAVLLARLGVHKPFRRNKIGTEIIEFIKGFFTINNKTGCRFILVDAYNTPEVIAFYKENEFDFLLESDKEKETRLMYYDLLLSIPSEN